MMTTNEYLNLFEIHGEIYHIRYMIDMLTKGVQETPIEKGALGLYKCKQDIIERDERLLENLELIQKYLHKLCDSTKNFVANIETKEETQEKSWVSFFCYYQLEVLGDQKYISKY